MGVGLSKWFWGGIIGVCFVLRSLGYAFVALSLSEIAINSALHVHLLSHVAQLIEIFGWSLYFLISYFILRTTLIPHRLLSLR